MHEGKARCKVVAVAAAATDVGKRTVAANLATAFAAASRKVVLLQSTHSPEANVRTSLGALARTTQPQSSVSLCTQIDALRAALQDTPAPTVAALDAPELFLGLQVWHATQLTQTRQALARLNCAADVLVVNTPIDAPVEQAQVLGARAAILVVTPNRAAITATYRMLKTLGSSNDQFGLQVLVNQAQDLDQAKRVFDNIAYAVRRYLSASVDFLGYLPNDPVFAQAAQRSGTVVEHHPDSPAARQLHALANGLLAPAGESIQAPREDSLLAAMRGELQQSPHTQASSH